VGLTGTEEEKTGETCIKSGSRVYTASPILLG
jgi:hypothetical protein